MMKFDPSRLTHIRHVVGICGPLQSGKTTAAKWLKEKHGFTRTRFADRLKKMLHGMGIPWEYLDGDKKNVPLEILGGQTARHAMKTLGSQWGRHCIHEDLWIYNWLDELRDLSFQCNYKTYDIVADDLRFPNERAAIRSFGGLVLRVHRPGYEHDVSHESEAHVLQADHIIENDGSLEDLYAKVDDFAKGLVPSPQDG